MLKVRDPTKDQNQVEGPFADYLVGDVNISALRVPCLDAHRISLRPSPAGQRYVSVARLSCILCAGRIGVVPVPAP
jgi:hypothetical protein